MTNVQTIVDGIHAAIEIPESVPPDRLEQLARDYTQICLQINRNLEECGRFLRAGNPCEAVRLAESTPPLLDQCNIVDFPERDDWNSICKSLNLPVASLLNASAIEQLNNGYNIVYELEPLLKEHRRLALARAPIKERLAVLYQLAQHEPDNILWSEMIDKYEEARGEEIAHDFEEARNNPASGQLVVELMREIDSTPWTKKPPEALVLEIRTWVKKAIQRQNIQQFRVLVENWKKATQNNDYTSARHWQQQWLTKLRSARITSAALPDDIRKSEAQAAAWTAQADKTRQNIQSFKETLIELETELGGESDPDDLSDIYARLTELAAATDNPIPENLLIQYRDTMHKLRHDNKRWRIIVVIGIIIAVCMILLVTMLIIGMFRDGSQVNNAVENVSRLLDQYENNDAPLDTLQKVEKAIQSIQNTIPDAKKQRIFLNVEKRYQTLLEEDASRAKNLSDLLKAIGEELSNKSFSKQNFDELSERAVKLVKTTDEQNQLDALLKKKDDLLNSQLQEEDSRLQGLLGDLRARTEALSDEQTEPSDTVTNTINQLKKEVTELATQTEQFPSAEASRYAISDEINRLESEMTTRKVLWEKIDSLVLKVGVPSEFVAEMRMIASESTQSRFVRDAQQVIAELDTQKKINRYNDFNHLLQNEKNYRQYGNSVPASQQFLQALNTIKTEAGFIPECGQMEQTTEFFAPLVEAGGRNQLNAKLDKFLSDHAKPLWVLFRPDQDNKGGTYFYFCEQEGKKTLWSSNGTYNTVAFSDEELQKLQMAPHHRALTNAIDRLHPLLSDSWFDVYTWYDMIHQYLRDFDPHDPDNMDPLLKVVMLRDFLAIVLQDPLMAKHFTMWNNRLNQDSLAGPIDWSRDDSHALASRRTMALSILNGLPKLESQFQSLEEELNRLIFPIRYEYNWIGFLIKRKNWESRIIPDAKDASGSLFIFRKTGDNTIVFHEIGKCDHGECTFDSPSDLMLEGLPIYLRTIHDFATIPDEMN